MNTTYKLLAFLALVSFAGILSSCVTTRMTLPDGTSVETTAPIPGAVETAAALTTAVASRVVRSEK